MDASGFWQKNKRRSLWQHPLWKAFQEKIGRPCWTVQEEGAQALVVRRAMPFGMNWLEVPRGPLFENPDALFRILGRIRALGEKEQSVFIRFSCYDPQITHYELRVRNYDSHPQTSLVLDLGLSEENLLAQMKPKGRYNIRLAQKHNVAISAAADVEAFYQLLKATAERDGFYVHSLDYYRSMMEVLGEKAHLLLATYEDRVIAGGIFVYLDEWAIYYYGASDHHYRNIMAPYLLQWEAIQEGKRRGCRFYDFLGIAPADSTAGTHPWKGVTEFKKKFGGTVVAYPQAREMVLRPFLYWLYRAYKRLK